MPSQVELIGRHPLAPDIFEKWFASCDIAPSSNKCHRSLIAQKPSNDDQLTDWLARKIISHHYSPDKLERLKQKYHNIGFPQYAAQHRQIPSADRTRKGNATEIILIEYIQSCQPNRNLFKAYKFRYNPNVDQSMKGDDALMVDIITDQNGKEDLKVFLGEAKFRGVPDRKVLEELSSSLGKDKLPISYSFLIDELYRDPATEPIAKLFENFIMVEVKARGNMKYAGLLLSNTGTFNFVERHFACANPDLVFISAGMERPEDLIAEAFRKAEELINQPDRL